MNDPLPFDIADVVEVREDHRGRGLYALRDIKAGEVIFTEDAHCWAIQPKFIDKFCNSCFEPIDKDSSCAACHIVRYCSISCQRSHWPIHKLECDAMKHFVDNIDDNPELMSEVIETARMMMIHQSIKNHSGSKPLRTALLKAAQSLSRAEQMAALDIKLHDKSDITEFVTLLRAYLNHSSIGQSCVDSIESTSLPIWRRQWQCNGLPLRTDDFEHAAAVGMFPLVSLINHSCDYNSTLINSETSMNVIAFKDILKDEELTSCYVNHNATTNERRTNLKKFGFHCVCPLCCESDDGIDGLSDRDRKLSGIRCDQTCEGYFGWSSGSVADITCSVCHRVVNANELQNQVDAILLEIVSVSSNDRSLSVNDVDDEDQFVHNLIKRVDAMFHPSHSLHVKLANAIIKRPDVPFKQQLAAYERLVEHARINNDPIAMLVPYWMSIVTKMQIEGDMDVEQVIELKKRTREAVGETHPFYLMTVRVERDLTGRSLD